MIKKALIFILLLLPFFSTAEPLFTSTKQLNFGIILGRIGSCYLNPATEILSPLSGSFCPSFMQRGTRAEHVIHADPNTIIRIRFKSINITADGLIYTPDGVFVVSGSPDAPINANTYHDIDSGASGTITMYVGGTLSSSINYPNSYTYSYDFVDGIEWYVQ
jgi:hypothetical protein